ncbi:MAG: SDR family oxidoreductase [Myxococcales bacterium]|nr:SDR family oxidoreductase [Myxococcales bacterium]
MMDDSLTGRSCLVTGANTGIGRVTAVELARRGAKVWLAGRSAERTMPVVEEIARAHGPERAEFLKLDLGSLASVRSAAETFLARGEPLHVLVNNAGLAGQRGITADGFELHLGTNHVGHFLFTLLLKSRLVESAPARVVTVASVAHYKARGIDLAEARKSTKTFVGMAEYQESKLANVLFSAELGRRLAGSGVTTYALHPGVVASDVWRRLPWPARQLAKLFMLTNEDGAKTSLHCATAPELATETGKYYDACREKTPSRQARDLDLARTLWEQTERWTDCQF